MQELVKRVGRKRQQKLTLGHQNLRLARWVLRQMLVEHFVHKISNLDVSPNQCFKFRAPGPTQIVQLAQARKQRFVAAGQPDVIKHALSNLVTALVEQALH
jgi:hypothetical protein